MLLLVILSYITTNYLCIILWLLWLSMAIILVAINGYFINGDWWLLMVILLVPISGY